jgi:hypothetical protein
LLLKNNCNFIRLNALTIHYLKQQLTMKQITLFFLLLVTIGSSAQRVTRCGFKIPPKSLRQNFASVYEAKSIVQSMIDSIKWNQNFNLKESNGIENAYATVISGKRWIIYDNNFLENLDTYSNTKWASISVMAHEVGHHYYNHVLSGKGSTVPTEIEADKFCGYVLRKMGANLQQASAAMTAVATDYQTSTHPAKKDRLNAISFGWNAADKETSTQPINNNGTGVGTTGSGTGSTGGTKPPTGTGGTGSTGTGTGSTGSTGGTKPPTGTGGTGSTGSTGSGTGGTKPPTGTGGTGSTGGTGGTGSGSNGTGGSTGGTKPTFDPNNELSYIKLSMENTSTETIALSDDGKIFHPVDMEVGKPFLFRFEKYEYGWLRLKYYNGARTFKLSHGKDYIIAYNRRRGQWTCVEVTD